MLEKTTRMNALYDYYGELLGDRRRRAFELYYLEDLSLAEIAEALGVSRQAAHEHVRRAEAELERLEQALGLWAKARERAEVLVQLEAVAAALEARCPAAAACVRGLIGRLRALD
ncbi:MAG: YlxM family DNA-binding protein [Hydrogenibacillus sp.]|nr:YlxM family DNA-binding protein [Hydrogenibacillus sp.]